MKVLELAADGDYLIPQTIGNVAQKEKTTVIIFENVDVATVTFGLADQDGNFLAFASGVVVQDAVINHGSSAKLMVRIAGITSNPVTIGYSD